jgi:hypothetical protein
MSRTVAEGRIQKLLFVVLAFVAVIGLSTWYPSFSQGYAVKNAGKLACNDLIRQTRFKVEGQEEQWREGFLRRASVEGVKLKPTQYTFNVSKERVSDGSNEFSCKVHITYPVTMEYAFIGGVFDIKPIETVKVLKFEHRVRENF